MIGLAKRIVAFVRWLLAPERLPAVPSPSCDTGPHRSGFLRWLGQRETLGTSDQPTLNESQAELLSQQALPQVPARLLRSRGFITWLASGEQLPQLDEATGQTGWSKTFPGWILSAQTCPQEQPPTGMASGGFVRRLLSPEVCPEGEPITTQRNDGLGRRLLAPEVCPQREEPSEARKGRFLGWLFSRETCPEGEGLVAKRGRSFLGWLFAPEEL